MNLRKTKGDIRGKLNSTIVLSRRKPAELCGLFKGGREGY